MGLIWLAFIGALGFRWAIADRGLDFTDESFALLAAQYPGEMKIWASVFFDYTAPLLSLAGGDIATVRRLGLLLLLGAAATLAHGVGSRMGSEGAPIPGGALFPILGLGSLVYYSRGISVPNYNLITASGLMAGLGLYLLAQRRPHWSGQAALAGAGFALAVAAGSKPPAVVALVAVTLWTAFRSRGPVDTILLGTGAAAAAGISLVHRSPTELFELLRNGVEFNLVRGYGYSPLAALGQYLQHAIQMLLQAGAYAAPSVLLALGLRSWKRPALVSLLPLVALIVTLGMNEAVLGGRAAARGGRTSAAILAAMIVCALPGWSARSQLRPSHRALLAAALVLPAVGVLGTNTNFASAVLLFMGPWLIVVPICLQRTRMPTRERLVRSALPAFVAGSAAVTAPYVSPYGLTAPFAEQNVATSLGAGGATILTDRQTSRFLGRLQAAAAACGFTPGKDIIALMDMPGFVFALGGVSPGVALYPREGDGIERAIRFALSSVPEDRLRRSFVLVNDHALRLGNFVIAGRGIHSDYEVCFDRDGPSKYGDMRVRLLRPGNDRRPQ